MSPDVGLPLLAAEVKTKPGNVACSNAALSQYCRSGTYKDNDGTSETKRTAHLAKRKRLPSYKAGSVSGRPAPQGARALSFKSALRKRSKQAVGAPWCRYCSPHPFLFLFLGGDSLGIVNGPPPSSLYLGSSVETPVFERKSTKLCKRGIQHCLAHSGR